MKILAVRGKNLASLAGHFEVDFGAPPLERAGLIAITGPTGAGKTTLLDAVCLALFDRTPRFSSRGGVEVGSDDLRANDVRGILRHGAVEGWAEVDFLGIDEQRWRSRWVVRRARGRAEGKIQGQQMSLTAIATGARVAADRKGDVLQAIEDRLGLDFDQFRRSVLLAQGEFAAFLEANGAARAELLERMTGTSLYRELGKAAYDRAKQAEQALEDLQRQRDPLAVLPDEARAELQAQADQLRREQVEQVEIRDRAAEALRWLDRDVELSRELDAATRERQRAERARGDLRDRERTLAQVRELAPLREHVQARAVWDAERDASVEELEFLAGDYAVMLAERGSLEAKLAAAEEALTRARERRSRLAPALDEARVLDTQIVTAEEARVALADKQARARAQLDAATTEVETLDDNLRLVHDRAEVERRWLAARPHLGELVAAWGHMKMLLQQQLRDLEARDAAAREREAVEPTAAAAAGEVEALQVQWTRAKRARGRARKALEKVERELEDEPKIELLRARQRELEFGRRRLDALVDIHAEHVREQQVAHAIAAERSEYAAERETRTERAKAAARELEATEVALEEARRALRQLEAVRDLGDHRVDLRPGEACPLCGATEHPATEGMEVVEDAVTAQRGRVEELSTARDERHRERTEHASRAELAAERLRELDGRLATIVEHARLRQTRWLDARAAGPVLPGGEPDPDGAHSGDAVESGTQLSLLAGLEVPAEPRHAALPDDLHAPELGTRLAELRAELDRLAAELARDQARVDTLWTDQRARQQHRDLADAEYERLRGEVQRAERRRDALDRQRDDARRKIAALDESLAERRGELDDTVPPATLEAGVEHTPSAAGGDLEGGAGADVIEDTDTLLRALRADAITLLDRAAEGYRERARALESAEAGRATLATKRAELASTVEARSEAVLELASELEGAGARVEALRTRRAALLDGRPVDEVYKQLEGDAQLAEGRRDEARDALGKLEIELKAAATRLAGLRAQVETLRRRSADAATRQRELMAGLDGLERELVDSLLDRRELWTGDWADATAAAIESAEAALARARAIADERERVRAAHRGSGPPSLERERAEDIQARYEDDAAQLRRRLVEVERALLADADARARLEALAPQIARRSHDAQVWGRLRDAIGDATGAKFQKFAQSLTLELLLAQANAQLRALKPRYSLARVPKHDLELQLVDHDLGDEVRSIRGLSGGEKFLVSLALALGLATLSADDCRIDSLFIDEGFGTLDSRSLDVAVSTLDALQAEGRQIAVISHVPGLAERIGVEIQVRPHSSGRSTVHAVAV